MIPGNRRQDCEFLMTTESQVDKVLCHFPGSRLYPRANKWIFEVWEFIPGPGPGDFQEEFTSIGDAIPVILDYYFGNPSKMNPPELIEYEQEYPD